VAVEEKPARAQARWRSEDDVWLDHAVLSHEDIEWLSGARRATLWAVKTPPGMLALLPNLEFLDYRGGSGTGAEFVVGCRGLRTLIINQVRGLRDLSQVSTLDSLKCLELFGLPQVESLPSLASLLVLMEVRLGSMKGLQDLSPLFDAPALESLTFLKSVSATLADARGIRDSPTIKKFEWLAEDVPAKVWVPFVEMAGKSGDVEKSTDSKK
jgi:hypothetical protein